MGPANSEIGHTAELGERNHTIKMDYVEHGGDALASLSWDTVIKQPTDAYRAQYGNAAPGVNAIPDTIPELECDGKQSITTGGEGSSGG